MLLPLCSLSDLHHLLFHHAVDFNEVDAFASQIDAGDEQIDDSDIITLF